jgi:hypothetical protein
MNVHITLILVQIFQEKMQLYVVYTKKEKIELCVFSKKKILRSLVLDTLSHINYKLDMHLPIYILYIHDLCRIFLILVFF